jgi:starvation-inducible DNA-binding protein
LDEIIEITRDGSDEVAERIAALGIPADGRSSTVARNSQLESYPETFQTLDPSISNVANAIHKTTSSLRDAIKRLGELDPISEDLCIALCRSLEKQLWMIQSQEIERA